jgi:hypothetical protein
MLQRENNSSAKYVDEYARENKQTVFINKFRLLSIKWNKSRKVLKLTLVFEINKWDTPIWVIPFLWEKIRRSHFYVLRIALKRSNANRLLKYKISHIIDIVISRYEGYLIFEDGTAVIWKEVLKSKIGFVALIG